MRSTLLALLIAFSLVAIPAQAQEGSDKPQTNQVCKAKGKKKHGKKKHGKKKHHKKHKGAKGKKGNK